jgi:hypothetical protein
MRRTRPSHVIGIVLATIPAIFGINGLYQVWENGREQLLVGSIVALIVAFGVYGTVRFIGWLFTSLKNAGAGRR